jgi:putative membrane protein
MIRTLTLAALSTALFASAAGAQSASKSAVNDSLFAMVAADGGLTEVTLAELGVQKATDPALKKFSEHMVAEHTKLNSELMALATKKGMTLPRTISYGHQFTAQSLAGLSGEEFDRCYAKAQLILHMTSVAAFEAEAERGQDADVKALAAKGLTHIKEHLKEIKPIAMKYEKEKPSAE